MEEITDENVKAAIQVAARSLARCEQCREGLKRKLLQKEFDQETIKEALDYLEMRGYLDDTRYASSWIRNHCAFKAQGRIRILRELMIRGVSKEIASDAIEEYFSVNSEMDLCEKAFSKYYGQKKDPQKIMKSLADSGFSYKMIQTIFKKKKV